MKIPSDSKTRWLSIQPAVDRIVFQWLELKTHFQIVRQSEKCYTAELLFQMYCNEKNLAILLFLQPILTEVQRTNILFESKNVDKMKLLDDLLMLLKTIFTKLILPTCKADPLTCKIKDYLDPKAYLDTNLNQK